MGCTILKPGDICWTRGQHTRCIVTIVSIIADSHPSVGSRDLACRVRDGTGRTFLRRRSELEPLR